MPNVRKPSPRVTVALVAAVLEMLAEVFVDYEGPIRGIWRALMSATGATAIVLIAGCSDYRPEWDFEPVRDPRIQNSANAVIESWEEEYGTPMSAEAVTDLYGTPVGFTDVICQACGEDPGCPVDGCFSPSRQAILLDANLDSRAAFKFVLPHEHWHAAQWYELGFLDSEHKDPSWATAVPRAKRKLLEE